MPPKKKRSSEKIKAEGKGNRKQSAYSENRSVVAKGEKAEGKDEWRVSGEQMPTIIYIMDKQQDPTLQHRELDSISCDKTKKKNTYVCVQVYCMYNNHFAV